MKLTTQRLREIIKEEIQALPEYSREEVNTILRGDSPDPPPPSASPGGTLALQYVRNSPEEAGKMLEDLLQGITLIKQQASELSARFNQLKPDARNRAAHELQEIKTILEGIRL